MWVHETASLAFIHIPKTSGTLVTDQLNMNQKHMAEPRIDKAGLGHDMHSTGETILKITQHFFPTPVLFTVVRNPYSRTHSMWRHYVKMHKTRLADGISDKQDSVDYDKDILRRYADETDGFVNFLTDRPHWQWHPKYNLEPSEFTWQGWWPQTRWTTVENSPNLVRVFKNEKLDALAAWIRQYAIVLHTEHRTKTTGGDYRKVYTNSFILDRVYDLFKEDFEAFGYGKKL